MSNYSKSYRVAERFSGILKRKSDLVEALFDMICLCDQFGASGKTERSF